LSPPIKNPDQAAGPETFPSIRSRMGDWWYYATTMSLAQVVRWVKPTDQIHSNAQLREWIQRELDDKRPPEIARYLTQQPQHFFNAIIVGIWGGEPDWYPLDVRDSPVRGEPQLDEASRRSMGLLRLRGEERVFAIDGQHRVAGIGAALAIDEGLGVERICVLFVGHRPDEGGRERTRRLFSTVNRQAKPVSKGEIVALDEDDAFAIVTRMLVERFEPLTGHRVWFGRQANVPKSNHSAVTTILALYDVTRIVSWAGAAGQDLRNYMRARPADDELEKIYRVQESFWLALIRRVPAIRDVLSSDELENAAAPHRSAVGGNLLLRPAGQIAFARAARVLMTRGASVRRAVQRLSGVPLDLAKPPWAQVLWDPQRRRMITNSGPLAHNLFLHLVGEKPEPSTFDLEGRYLKATGTKLTAAASARPRRPYAAGRT